MSTFTVTNPCVAGVQCMQAIETIEGNGYLKVNHVSYAKDGAASKFVRSDMAVEEIIRMSPAWHAELRALLDAEVPVEVTLTSDGGRYSQNGWHTGEEAEWVQVERWTPEGRVFHGFIDSVSRRLVQAG